VAFPGPAHSDRTDEGGALDVVGIAASAGGLRALTTVFAALPPDFPAPIAVVQHLDPRHPSLLAGILGRATRLLVKEAQEGEGLRPGVVFLAPPDRHLLVNANATLTLTRTELVHFVRPSADLLFESLAASVKARTLAVVLSGSGSDGAMGLRAIKRMGGTTIAQDEATSEFFGMPEAAIRSGLVDMILPLDRIAGALLDWTRRGELRGAGLQ
jgi:two-component system, chemotaxis family, protein-glutamate methylesterase/glutaminase